MRTDRHLASTPARSGESDPMTGDGVSVGVAGPVSVGRGDVAVGSTGRVGLGTGADSTPHEVARMRRMLKAASRRMAGMLPARPPPDARWRGVQFAHGRRGTRAEGGV